MDQALLKILNDLVELPGLHQLSWLVDQSWAPLLLLVLVVADVLRRRRWIDIGGVVAAVVVADLLCARVLKPMIARPRPCAELSWVLAPFGCGAAFSMPSCHAANLFALAMVVNRPWAFALAAVCTLTRSVAGVHYPSDLMVGAVLGLGIGWLVRLGLDVLAPRRKPAKPKQRNGRVRMH
jgi:membrane-associated phospholipid phosphatase